MKPPAGHNQRQATQAHRVHIEIAEGGKVEALAGNHKKALEHYREAMRLAVSISAPEVFFRHYTQCVLESLELTKSYQEIIEFCLSADAHYRSLSLNDPLHGRDHAGMLERLGIVLLKSGKTDEAKQTLDDAIALAGKNRLPLSELIRSWLIRGLVPDTARLLTAQKQHNYFTVRRGQVDKSRARALPKMNHHSKAKNSMAGFKSANSIQETQF